MQQSIPVLVLDVLVDQLLDLLAASRGGGLSRGERRLRLMMLEAAHQRVEIDDAEAVAAFGGRAPPR
jgi:hypothetical protein